MERVNFKVTKNKKTSIKVSGMLYKTLVIMVIFLAFIFYFARLPETGAYFYHRVESHTYKVEIDR